MSELDQVNAELAGVERELDRLRHVEAALRAKRVRLRRDKMRLLTQPGTPAELHAEPPAQCARAVPE